jgi:hypothetical protein
LEHCNRENGLHIDHHTAVPELDEGPLDYQMAMDIMIQSERTAIDDR